MKDNYPNYLNPHNIDPGRIEPAHIDTPPGNDSIRPGMNKCEMPNAECEMREDALDLERGAPFDEYGIQIALAGGDWSKGIQDYAEQRGPFPSDSRLRHFVRHGQPPTMSNAEAISILENIETDIYGRISIAKAIDALNSPWVKTADRLPTKDDVDSRMNVMAWHIWYGAEIVDYGVILDDPAMYIWWAPMPSLPEVEK